jgi:hypothetical protein
MGKKSRTKGETGEREVAALAVACGFPKAKRTAQMQAGGYADEYGDVGDCGISYIECKRYRKVPVNAFAKEYLLKEKPGFVSVLAWRDDHAPWFATVLLEEWLKLTAELESLRSFRTQMRNEADGRAA